MKEYTVKVYEDRTEWFFNDKLHRDDGPAVECADGYKSWYINGKLHRDDGPARECANGYKSWYINGKLHRDDGPAAEWADGSKYWYINGEPLAEQEFLARTNANYNNCAGIIRT